MQKHRRRILFAIAGIVILAVAFTFAYRSLHHESQRAYFARSTQPPAPGAAVEKQMLQGKFGQDIPAEERQIVSEQLRAPDQPSLNQSLGTQAKMHPGGQQIVPTQPLATTIEDTQPTLTWDARIDGWSYRVRVDDRDSHETVVTSPVLDEAMWRMPTPLLRGHTYLWRVDAMPTGVRTTAATTSSTAQFAVLSDTGEQEIQNARSHKASHLLLGSLYTHYEMWRDAVQEYRKMVDEVPDSPEALKLLRNAELRSSSQLASRPAQ